MQSATIDQERVDKKKVDLLEAQAREELRKEDEAAELERQNAEAIADGERRRAQEEAALEVAREADKALVAEARALGARIAAAYREGRPEVAAAVERVVTADRHLERRAIVPRSYDAMIAVSHGLKASLTQDELRALIQIVTCNQ